MEAFRIRVYILCVVVSFIGLGSISFAGTELYDVIDNASRPYMVVVEVDSGSSDKDPGIYVGDSYGRGWKLVLPGKVLMDFKTSTAFRILELSSVTKRFESLVVINGYLTYLNIDSNVSDKNFIAIGSASKKIYDPILGELIELPKIESISDLSVYITSFAQEHLVIVSQKFNTPMMPGITYAFTVDFSSLSSASTIKENPVVLDYNFYSTPLLSRFIYSYDAKGLLLKSPYIARVLSKPNSMDPDRLIDWRLKLASLVQDPVAYLKGASSDTIPLYNYKKSEIQLSNPIMEQGKKSGVSLMQQYDPIRNRTILSIMNTENYTNNSYKMDARKYFRMVGDISRTFVRERMGQDIVRYRTAEDKLNDNIYKCDNYNYAIFFVDSVPYFFPVHKDGTPVRLLSSPEVQNVSHFSVLPLQSEGQAKTPKSQEPIVFLLSFQNIKQEAATYLYRISYPQASKEFVVSDKVLLSSKFYSVEELKARLSGGLFDIDTPKQENLQSYEQAHKKFLPHIDIMKSDAESGLAVDFLEPLSTKVFEEGFEYRIYGDEYSPADKSGLYINNVGYNYSVGYHLVFGEIIPEPTGKHPYWASKAIKTKNLGNMTLYYVVLDKLFHKGSESYSSALVVRPTGDNIVRPFVIPVGSEQEPQSSLNFVMILAVKDYDFFYILRSHTKFKGSKKSKNILSIKRVDIRDASVLNGRAYTTPEDLAYRMMNESFKVQDGNYKVLAEGENLSPEEVVSRILVSKDRVFYWSVIPDINMNDPEFKVKEFGKDIVFKPADMAESISFAPYKEFMEKGVQSYAGGYEYGPAYNWKIKGPSSSSSPEAVKALYDLYKVGKLSSRSYSIFPDFLSFLDTSVRSTQNSKYVIVVPDGLEQYIRDLVYGRLFESPASEAWAVSNPNVDFYTDRGNDVRKTAADYMNYLSSITKHARSSSKSLFLVDLRVVMEYNRPQGHESYKLTYEVPKVHEEQSSFSSITEDQPFSEYSRYPHAMYYILTEGNKVQYQDFKQYIKDHPYAYTTFIFATKTEWDLFKEELEGSPEEMFDILSAVQVHELAPPDETAQINLFKDIFHSRDVQSKGYVFDVSAISRDPDLTDVQKEEVFIKYLISRMNALAVNASKNKFEILLDLLTRVKTSLLVDPSVRRRGIIDRKLAENLLSQVFDLPLNIEYLPENDPLRILSRPDIVTLIQDKGRYRGFNHLAVIEAILAQIRPESTKNIPASIILFGESGTGKTELFKALVRTLDLKLYDPTLDLEKNNEAQAFILNCSKIVNEKTTGRSDLMSVKEAIDHLHKFLSLPLGYRGFILFDDLHATDATVRHVLVSQIRTMLDTDKTEIAIKSEGGDTVYDTIKNRNLTIFITLNPTSDTERLSRFSSDRNKKNLTDEEKILATLSTRSDSLEMSFLRRFGLIYPMSSFPKDAKKSSLADKLNPLMKDTFTRRSLVIPSSSFINTMVSSVPEADAREFLAGVTNGVSQKISLTKQQYDYDSSGDSSIFIMNARLQDKGEDQNRKETKDNREIALINFITQNTSLYSTAGLEGKLFLTRIIMDNFRINVFECFIESLKNSVFVTSPQNRITFRWIAAAIRDYVSENISIPINKLFLDAKVFGLEDSLEKEKFAGVINNYSQGVRYSAVFPMRTGTSDLMSIFNSSVTPSRLDVNYEAVRKNMEFLKKFLATNLGIGVVNSELSFLSFDDWIRNIDSIKTNRYSYSFYEEIFALYRDYLQNLSDFSLREVRSSNDIALTPYMKTRLFLASLDKAIMSLPWAEVTMFLNDNLIKAMNYMEISSKEGVQEFLFGGKASLIRPTVEDYIEILIKQYIQEKDLDKGKIKQQQQEFQEYCAAMFSEG